MREGAEWVSGRAAAAPPPPSYPFLRRSQAFVLDTTRQTALRGSYLPLASTHVLTCQRELNLSCVRKSGAQGPISAKAAPHSHFCLNLSTLGLSHLQDTQPIYTSGCEQTSVLSVQHSPFTSAYSLATPSLEFIVLFLDSAEYSSEGIEHQHANPFRPFRKHCTRLAS